MDEGEGVSREFPNGDNYVGDRTKGNANGRGLYCFADGSRVQGQWKDALSLARALSLSFSMFITVGPLMRVLVPGYFE